MAISLLSVSIPKSQPNLLYLVLFSLHQKNPCPPLRSSLSINFSCSSPPPRRSSGHRLTATSPIIRSSSARRSITLTRHYSKKKSQFSKFEHDILISLNLLLGPIKKKSENPKPSIPTQKKTTIFSPSPSLHSSSTHRFRAIYLDVSVLYIAASDELFTRSNEESQ
ncbi:unnamed protein product [Lactuca saligna]|uniref:Uncharacterized protein n=1 Tax=Lactuca saligna TaxID=75948 RepID=A0AA35VTT7_LACSI|nr:unnamed protein product [Lactuca saligna]